LVVDPGQLDQLYRNARALPAFAALLDADDPEPELDRFFGAIKGTGHRGAFRLNEHGYLAYIGCVMKGRTVTATNAYMLPELYAAQHQVPLPLNPWQLGLWRRRLAHDAGLLRVKRSALPKPRQSIWPQLGSMTAQLTFALALDGFGLLQDLHDEHPTWLRYDTPFATQWNWKRLRDFTHVENLDYRMAERSMGNAKMMLTKAGLLRFKKDERDFVLYRFTPDYAFGVLSSAELLKPYSLNLSSRG